MLIGICDDNELDIIKIEKLCEKYMGEHQISCQYVKFCKGEDVLKYCAEPENQTINLLFLDIEMPGINGIELKNQIVKNNLVYRIAFVTSHDECVYSAFSLKTIGFINKPSTQETVAKMIGIMLEDLKENVAIEYAGYRGERINIFIENILYFEAAESYTKIVTCEKSNEENLCPMISKKLGQIEMDMKENGFIRVHKSYMVNLAHVVEVGEGVCFRNYEDHVPIGRKYREQVRNYFLLFGKEQMRKRL